MAIAGGMACPFTIFLDTQVYGINAAYQTLSDETKRREYDQLADMPQGRAQGSHQGAFTEANCDDRSR